MLPNSLFPLVDDLKTVPGIRAIAIGGSRARGSGDASSDTDLGLYYDAREPLAIDVLDQVAVKHDEGNQSGLVTSIGGWGLWINGGGWLQVNGTRVDLLYRETSKMESEISRSIDGHYEVAHQPGHPFGFLSSIYTGEVAVCHPLWDPADWLATQKNRLKIYPELLRGELARRFGFQAGFSLLIAEKPVQRSDVAYVAGCLFHAMTCLQVVLFALNREYWLNEKGALKFVERFPIAPPGFRERVERVWRLVGTDSAALVDAIAMAQELNEDVAKLAEPEGLRADLSSAFRTKTIQPRIDTNKHE